MKILYKNIIAITGLLALFSTTAQATPAFAKQMNAQCMMCHYQNIPKLNTFGREFKSSGFTMINGTKQIEGTKTGGLALPATLNMGFITKARLHKTDSTAEKTEIFDEAAFIFGGKIAEGVGTSMEFGAGLLGGKIAFVKDTSAGRLGFTYFMTDALGAFSGAELYSTGLYRPIRQFENRSKANIFQHLAIGEGEATGFQAVYHGNGLTATVGQYAPAFTNSISTGSDYKTFVRASYEMNLSGYTVALGGYSITGDVSQSQYGLERDAGESVYSEKHLTLKSNGLDLQVEGNLSGMPMMLTAGYVLANTYTEAAVDYDKTGYSAGFQINPVDYLGLKLGYLSAIDNVVGTSTGESSIIVGTEYMYAQNVRISLELSNTSYELLGKKDSTDMLFMSMIAF